MHFGPPLYRKQLLLRALRIWVLLRAALAGLTLVAGWSRPFVVAPLASLGLVAAVVALGWIELRRRNLTTLLPTLGVSNSGILALLVACAASAELAIALAVG
ncbi:MAG: hypothetical protein IT352_04815 [Gemmatimonadales bacterium]|nr:hypothetical protein [Gemmatimonadales bacterium]